MGYEMGAATNRRLTPEEIQHLLQNLSSDEQKELGNMLKSCTTEMTLTRGLPFAAAVVGSLYFARQRLPPALHFGPKKWPFYFVVGIGALTTANLFSMNTCTERIQPHLNTLWQKHKSASGQSSEMTHEELRRRNREGTVSVPQAQPLSQPRQPLSTSAVGDWRGTAPQRGYGTYDEPPSYMSGTPVDPRQTPEIPVGTQPHLAGTREIPVGTQPHLAGTRAAAGQAALGSANKELPAGTPLGGGGAPQAAEWKKTQYGDEGFS